MIDVAVPIHPQAVKPKLKRGLNREEAAQYCGISVSFFDTCVFYKKLPLPIKLGNRRIWDLHDLDRAFDKIKREQGIEDDNMDERNPYEGITDVSGRNNDGKNARQDNRKSR